MGRKANITLKKKQHSTVTEQTRLKCSQTSFDRPRHLTEKSDDCEYVEYSFTPKMTEFCLHTRVRRKEFCSKLELRLDKVLSLKLRTAQRDSWTCSGGKPDLPTLFHWQLVFHHSSIVTLSLPVILISNVIFPASSNQFGFSLLEMDHCGIEREFQQSRTLSRL